MQVVQPVAGLLAGPLGFDVDVHFFVSLVETGEQRIVTRMY